MSQLKSSLKKAGQSQRNHLSTALLLRSLKYLFIAFILVLTTDVIFHLSPQKRITGLILYCSLLGLGISLLFWRTFVTSRSLKNIARDIEKNSSGTGSALINTLDLQQQIDANELQGNSKELAAMAITSYSNKINLQSFKDALNPARLVKELKWAIGIFILLALLLIPVRHILQLELLRFFDPYGDHPPYSLTSLLITSPADDKFLVVFGEDLLIKAQSSGHRPDELFISFYPQGQPSKARTLPMFNKGELGFSQKLENLREEIDFYVHTTNKRSQSKIRQVGLILTPKVEKAQVIIKPPKYTGLKTTQKIYNWKNISALKGSQVSFVLYSNRPLKKGIIEKTANGESKKIDMNATKNKVIGGFTVKENSRLRFDVYDISGLKSVQLLKGSLTATFDRPPTLTILSPDRSSFVTEDFNLKVKFQASDDYGIKEMRLHRAINGFYGPPLIFTPEDKNLNSLTQVVPMPIGELGVKPGDIISIYADTLDNSPAEQTASTPVIKLQVVSIKEYNDYLREQAEIDDIVDKYENMRDKLTDLIEEQKKVNKEISELAKKIADNKISKKLQEQLDSLIRKQGEVNSKLAKLAKEMEEFGRDKPLYDIEKEFTKQMKEMAEKIKNSLEENQDELEEFAKNSDAKNSPKQIIEALQALQKAGEKQRANLDRQNEEYSERVLETLLDLSLMNALIRDFNRFKRIYQLQKILVEQVRRYNVIRELSHSDKLNLKKKAATEKYIHEELNQLVDDLLFDAEEAELQFPKASKAARDLAEKINKARLVPLLEQAINSMLIPNGPESYQLAEKIRREMAKFFEDPTMGSADGQEPNPYMRNEFDQYLKLLLGMSGNRSFNQMSMSGKLGMGSNGRSSSGSNLGLLGNEQLGGKESKKSGDGQNSRSKGTNSQEIVSVGNNRDNKSRDSRKTKGNAVNSETLINEYESLIDAYFDKLTEDE